MFSLSSRLIASHVFVILLAIALVLIVTAAFLRRYETELEQARVREVISPLALATQLVGQQPGERGQIENRFDQLDTQAERLDVRILILGDEGRVVYDTNFNDSKVGEILPEYQSEISMSIDSTTSTIARSPRQEFSVSIDGDSLGGNPVVFASPPGSQGELVIAVTSTRDRFPLLRDYVPRLLLAGAVSLIAATVAGFLLSRRIANPIARLTRAARDMASGQLEQHVEVASNDEIGELARQFNDMSAQVSTTSRSQRDLLADVAHELRTPLTSVQGYAQGLQDGVIAGAENENAAYSTIRNEASRMSILIDQLLELSRLESGQVEKSRSVVDPCPLIENLVERFEPRANDLGVSLQSRCHGDMKLIGDTNHLDQIISNLVSNSLKHVQSGDSVSIYAARSGESISIAVQDTGDGIDPAAMPHIFDRFRSGDESGVGLGLPIVRELVSLHDGSIEVTSSPGDGTKVTVTFPAHQAILDGPD